MRHLQILVPGLLACGLFVPPLSAQWVSYPSAGVPRAPDGKPNLTAACPRTADGHPDLSGVWEMVNRGVAPILNGCFPTAQEFGNIGASFKDGLPYQPWAAELVKKRGPELRIHDPITHCLPAGVVRLTTHPLVKKVIQTPGLIVILNELYASYRQIFTDGRPLPADPNPSWNGYSSGVWEGDTLVVRTNGLRDGIWLDGMGNPLTDAAKITERFRRADYGHLEIELTVDDPKAYTKPWTVMLHQIIKLDTDLLDYICQEGERDVQHLVAQ
jgi:hypothetical protein